VAAARPTHGLRVNPRPVLTLNSACLAVQVTNTVDSVVPAERLRDMKRYIRTLDLSFLHTVFMSLAPHELGHVDLAEFMDPNDFSPEEGSMIPVVYAMALAYKKEFSAAVKCTDADALSAITAATAEAYKKFLVVKAVEAIVADAGPAGGLRWTEKCQASTVIDVLWHAHMLWPKVRPRAARHSASCGHRATPPPPAAAPAPRA